MTTLTKNTAAWNGFEIEIGNGWKAAGKEVLATARNVVLFLAAPFIGLAYLLAFPFIGIAMLLWVGAKALARNRTARRVGMLIAAPLIALAFVTIGPFAGLGALVWTGGKAILRT